MRLFGFALASALSAPGCAHPNPSASATVSALGDAILRDDAHAAWALLGKAARGREDEFLSRWRANRDELPARAEALRLAATAGRVRENAQVMTPDGRTLTLVRDTAGWRLAAMPTNDLPSATPLAVVRRLADALEHRDLRTILEMLAPPLRRELELDLSERVAGLQAVLHRQNSFLGDRFSITYGSPGSSHYITLERDATGWRITGFN